MFQQNVEESTTSPMSSGQTLLTKEEKTSLRDAAPKRHAAFFPSEKKNWQEYSPVFPHDVNRSAAHTLVKESARHIHTCLCLSLSLSLSLCTCICIYIDGVYQETHFRKEREGKGRNNEPQVFSFRSLSSVSRCVGDLVQFF